MPPSVIPSVLACDVGNSGVRIAVVTGADITEPQAFSCDQHEELATALVALWEQTPSPRRAAASSVAPDALAELEDIVGDAIDQELLVVGRDLPLPMATALGEPQSVGTDRICAAVAAYDRLGTACVVADFGTAITVDYVDDRGVFQGGAILPGLTTAAKSLNTAAAQLPDVAIRQPEWVIGDDTPKAILTGLLASARGALRHLVEAYATHWGHWPLVIVTGRDAPLVCNRIAEDDLVQAIVPDLVLRGVAMAYYNSLTAEPK